ncbi:hypothetical protein FJTKL_03925 [Diaporthe vaccinii]|uniref:Uncharacterized protein n=1 Tax=Diaporthe vaccinii TaxID=105482 RepID=A0ABR4F1J0_9PEZI
MMTRRLRTLCWPDMPQRRQQSHLIIGRQFVSEEAESYKKSLFKDYELGSSEMKTMRPRHTAETMDRTRPGAAEPMAPLSDELPLLLPLEPLEEDEPLLVEATTTPSMTGAGTGTVVHVLLDGGGRSGDQLVGDLPVLGRGRALGSGGVGVELAASRGVGGVLEGGGQLLEVLVGGDIAVLDLDDTVSVGLDRVLIGDAAGEDRGHVGGVQRGDLAPGTLILNAAVLGQEQGDAVAGVLLDLGLPAGLDEVRGVAPRVVVEGEEVGTGAVVSAVEVLELLDDVLGDIGGRVAGGDGAVAAGVDVVLDVTGDGADVGGGAGRLLVVDDLVTAEEEQGVGVVGEGVDSREHGLQVLLVGEVDARVGEEFHSLVVVLRVVDRVHTDGVDAEVLEVLDVPLETRDVNQGVSGVSGTTWLVSHATDVETLVAGPECCMRRYLTISLDGDLWGAAAARLSGLERAGASCNGSAREEQNGRYRLHVVEFEFK